MIGKKKLLKADSLTVHGAADTQELRRVPGVAVSGLRPLTWLPSSRDEIEECAARSNVEAKTYRAALAEFPPPRGSHDYEQFQRAQLLAFWYAQKGGRLRTHAERVGLLARDAEERGVSVPKMIDLLHLMEIEIEQDQEFEDLYNSVARLFKLLWIEPESDWMKQIIGDYDDESSVALRLSTRAAEFDLGWLAGGGFNVVYAGIPQSILWDLQTEGHRELVRYGTWPQRSVSGAEQRLALKVMRSTYIGALISSGFPYALAIDDGAVKQAFDAPDDTNEEGGAHHG